MGLAASAASAILVKAEISNLELETQQIQRQKLNLANQSAAIEEKALQMEVPTAPSTYDPQFLKTVYEGKDASGNPVRAAIGNDGKLHASVYKEQVNTLKAPAASAIGAEEHSVAKKVDSAPEKKDQNTIVVKYQDATVEEGACNGSTWIDSSSYATIKQNISDAKTTLADESASDEDKQNAQAVINTYANVKPAKRLVVSDEYSKSVSVTDGNGTEPTYTKFAGADGVVQFGDWPTKPAEYKFDYLKSDQKTENFSDIVATSRDGFSKGQIDSIIEPHKYCVDDDGTELTMEHFIKNNGKLPSPLYQKMDHEEINGKQAYTIETAEGSFSGDDAKKVSDLINRIKTYVENHGGDVNNWRITQNTDGTFTAYRLEADGKATAFETDEGPGYDPNIKGENGEEPIVDVGVTGIGTVTMPGGAKVTVTESKKLDEEAYYAAQAQYNKDKAEYDRCQEEFNQETKKLQRVDKQFDMKLERLANERAALEKQLDDLDKVKEDNTEKSFSAFS